MMKLFLRLLWHGGISDKKYVLLNNIANILFVLLRNKCVVFSAPKMNGVKLSKVQSFKQITECSTQNALLLAHT